MNKRSWVRLQDSFSDNRKSKIQNLKWVGIVAIGVTFAMCGAVAQAQQAKKVPRVGLLASGRGFGTAGDAFRKALRELGWIEGKNIAIESRLAEVSFDRLPH